MRSQLVLDGSLSPGFTPGRLRCLKGMKSHTEDGILVLADISGFTAFVTATEIEHGPPMVAELLGQVMARLSPPLEIQEVEGDAVFALGPDRTLRTPASLLDVLEDAFAAFRTGSASSRPTRAARAGPAVASGASTSRSSLTTASSSGRWWAAAARPPAPMSSSRTAC